MVHEGSCAVQRDAGRVMLDHKGLDVHLLDGSFLITLHDLTWFRIVRFHLCFVSTRIAGQVMIPDPGSMTELVIPELVGTQYPGQFFLFKSGQDDR